jgi:hypothetical protein
MTPHLLSCPCILEKCDSNLLVCKASQKSNEITYMQKLHKNATSILHEQILTLVYAIAHTSFVCAQAFVKRQ